MTVAAERAIGRWSISDLPGSVSSLAAADARRGTRRRVRWRISLPGTIGLAIVALLVGAALLGPLLLDVDPARQDLRGRLAPPVWAGGDTNHLLGTDQLGHDVLARVIAGARVSLLIGVVATLAAGVIGVTLGLLAGATGGLVERLVSWIVDVQMALPFVVVGIALTAALGHGLRTVLLTLALTGWVGYARIVRLQALALRRAPFVEAARAVGVGPARLLGRHLLPNLTAPIAVVASQQVAAMILYEAALGYLGLGLPSGTITWGGMVASGRESLLAAPWVSTIPGLAIALAVLGFNLLGDGVRDLLDPEAR
ncbi:MAG: ABC transporter permease [Chloroflexota bacterium]|nr:ABC transporter permease [Chloroflexota bacterium]